MFSLSLEGLDGNIESFKFNAWNITPWPMVRPWFSEWGLDLNHTTFKLDHENYEYNFKAFDALQNNLMGILLYFD
jgi:hypothetical protein